MEQNSSDGLLRLANALSRNSQRELMLFLESASVDDLKLVFPILLNWCLVNYKCEGDDNDRDKNKSKNNDNNNVTTEIIAEKIVTILEESIEYETVHDNAEEMKNKNGRISSLRMKLYGFLHTNHEKIQTCSVIRDLGIRTRAKIQADQGATNTLNMVNLCSPPSLAISKDLETEEESNRAPAWEILRIRNIDLGLGLQQTSPSDICQEFIRDNKPVLHPFTGQKVDRMEVIKVFPSKRKPVWIRYHANDDKDGNDTTDRPIYPDALAKQGDNLRNDAAIASVSSLCESIWKSAPIKWKLGSHPTALAYDVVVTAPDAGYLEMVPGKNFLDLSKNVVKNSGNDDGGSIGAIFSLNKGNTLWEKVDVTKLAPSLVGAYITNFIIGVRDRHEDNMMVVGDDNNPKMMQLDFGYILMEYPGGVHFDMPRLTMPIALVDRLNNTKGLDSETTLMENLQHDMLAAYLVIRRHTHQFVPFCKYLLSDSYSPKYVEKILNGPHVFRTNQSETDVIQWFSQKLLAQWAHFYFRREVKQSMVTGYYNFVKGITPMQNPPNEQKEDAEGNLTTNFLGKISRFLTGRNIIRKGIADNGGFDDDEDDVDSVHSVPDVVIIPTMNNKLVYKNSRSQKSFVFENSIDQNSTNEDCSADYMDMSKLNERVSNAMKLQKQVSFAMISQKAKTGTLDLVEHDANGSVRSI